MTAELFVLQGIKAASGTPNELCVLGETGLRGIYGEEFRNYSRLKDVHKFSLPQFT